MAKKKATSASDFVPGCTSIKSLRASAAHCEGCELFKHATQTVFGRGPRSAHVMLVGEMPGDQEDKQGKPFVGPAGQLLREMVVEIGLDLNRIYLTNVVKHFRHEQQGKRRIHRKPSQRHIDACKPWLEAELFVVHPELVVCLGATAAQALLGKSFRLTKEHGKVIDNPFSPPTVATYHPSAILRAPDHQRRLELREVVVNDLRGALQQASLLER